MVQSLFFMVQSLFFMVQSLFFMVQSLFFMVQSLFFMVQCQCLMVQSLFFMVQSLFFMVQSLLFMVKSLFFMVQSLFFHGSIPIDPSQTHHIAPPWLHAMQAPRDIFRCHDRGRDWSDLRCSVNQLSFPTKWGCPVVVDTNRSGLKLRIWGLYIGCEWLKHVKTSQVEIVFVPKKWEVWEVQSDL